MTETNATPPEAATPRRRRRLPRALLAAAVLLAAILGAGIVFLASPAGVDFVVRELSARSGGALAIEGASGSLFDTVNLKRVEWHGRDTHMTADDVALTWNPLALFSRGIVVRGLGAKRLSIETKASTEDVPMPATLALPMEVRIERLGIADLEWRVGANGGTIRGLAFGYTGGADGHGVSDLTFVAPMGAITGNATIAAKAPFAIAGRLHAKGDAALAGTEADLAVSGSLATLMLEATGSSHNAPFSGRASLAPLAGIPWREVAVDAKGIDLAAWSSVLPATALDVVVRATPAGNGITGTIEATNGAIGAVDAGKVPLSTLSSRFTWRDDLLTLESLSAALTGGGAIAGSARIPLGDAVAAGSWTLELRDIDAHRIYAALVPTRLSGTLVADLGRDQQRFRGNVTDRTVRGGIGLEFSAVLANDVLVVERFRARSGKGELTGRGRTTLARERSFEVDATATSFDPSAYGAFPAGSLSGKIVASGTLATPWNVRADVSLAPGSRLSGIALTGTAHGTLTEKSVRDIAVNLAAGRSKLAATGAAGAVGDHLTLTIDSPDVTDLAALLPARLASSLAGSLHLKADFAGLPPQAGLDLEAKGEGLKLPGGIAAAKLELRAHVAPASSGDFRHDLATRKIDIDVAGTEVVTPSGNVGTLRSSVVGTLAEHAIAFELKGAEIDGKAAARGGFDMTRELGDIEKLTWKGTLDRFENHGTWTARLAAPATLEVARSRVRIGTARLAVADGTFNLVEFDWNDGRIATSGDFAAVPLATLARLAATPLPFTSTLTLSGEWKLATTPHLNGTLAVRRQGGDILYNVGPDAEPRIGVGITTLEARAKFDDDAIDASAVISLRARRPRRREARCRQSRGSAAGTARSGSAARVLGQR
jgi:translocation and assembly module TamB